MTLEAITGPFATASEVLREVARRYPDREAFVEAGARTTFGALDRAADRMAVRLRRAGVRKGDVVCVLLPSSIDYAVCYQAAMRIGAVTSGINTRMGPGEVASVITRAAPKVTVRDAGLAVPSGAGVVIERAELAALPDDELSAVEVGLDDTCCVVWTSGTTGAPKGAVFDHGCLRAVAEAPNQLTQLGDRKLNPLPFAHVGYMTRAWDELAHVVTTIISPTPWSAESMLRMIETERVTVGQGVPTQWRLVLNHPRCATTDFSSLRVAGSGAAIVPPDLVRDIRDRLHVPVVVGYSSTESSLVSNAVLTDDVPDGVNLVGVAYHGVEIRLVDDAGAVVPTGEVGNVQVRSRAMMRGYWKDPELTRAAFSDDGFCSLGDLGFFDADGNLALVGRRKEMYIRGGYNVYPAEVEAVLGEHPAVERVAVVGVPSPVLGEIGVAFVVPVPGAQPDLVELREWCKARISDYKAPDRLEVVAELPVNAMMKVDKQALIARVQGDS